MTRAPHYSTREPGLRRLEPPRARDVGVVGAQLRVETPRAPAEQLAHPASDRLRAIRPLTEARADPRAAEQDVLERHGQLVLHGEVELRDDVRVLRAELVGPARDFPREVDDARIGAPVECHERLERLAGEPRARDHGGDVEPGARLDAPGLLVEPVEREPVGPRGRPAAEGAHDGIAEPGREAPEAGEFGPGDRQKAPARLGDDLVGARDVGLALALLVRERPYARVRVDDALEGDARVRQRPADLAEEVTHLVARGVQPVEVADEVRVRRAVELALP